MALLAMKTGAAGRALIKGYEKLRLLAYVCDAGKLTIGWGHTRNVRAGQRCSPKEAEDFFSEDLAEAELAVNSVGVPFTQNQFDALVSLVFNIGVTAFATSTIRRVLQARDYKRAEGQFGRWNKDTSTGKTVVMAGLTERREKERQLFAL